MNKLLTFARGKPIVPRIRRGTELLTLQLKPSTGKMKLRRSTCGGQESNLELKTQSALNNMLRNDILIKMSIVVFVAGKRSDVGHEILRAIHEDDLIDLTFDGLKFQECSCCSHW